MVFKWLIVATAFLGAFTVAQYAPWGDELSDTEFKPRKKEACNETFCLFEPCVGSAPPPVCPSIIPNCPTGCACHMECPSRLICFMTSHCTKIRRFLTKRRHARTVSEHEDLQEFSESTVVHALVGRVDRDWSASTAVQPASTESEGKAGPGIPASVGVALSELVQRDILGDTAAENTRTLSNAIVSANVHSVHNAVLLVQSKSNYEKAVEAAAEKAAEAAAEAAAQGKAVSTRAVHD